MTIKKFMIVKLIRKKALNTNCNFLIYISFQLVISKYESNSLRISINQVAKILKLEKIRVCGEC